MSGDRDSYCRVPSYSFFNKLYSIQDTGLRIIYNGEKCPISSFGLEFWRVITKVNPRPCDFVHPRLVPNRATEGVDSTEICDAFFQAICRT